MEGFCLFTYLFVEGFGDVTKCDPYSRTADTFNLTQ